VLSLCSAVARQTCLSGLVAGLSGVVLIGFSIFLGNLPSRLIQPDGYQQVCLRIIVVHLGGGRSYLPEFCVL
jgi:hypothetical protein